MSLFRATNRAIKAASHLTEMDDGALEALRALARKIDEWDMIVEYARDDAAGKAEGARPVVPEHDNVSHATYLKYCDQLGLTPAGRSALAKGMPAAAARPSSKAAKLTALQGGRSAG